MDRYKELADRISEALDFMQACGLDLESHPELRAHRFLHQPRGAAARLRAGDDARRIRPPATGTAPPATWSGSATARASSTTRMSSICRGIKNPIGLKCGPSLKADELLRLIDILNPDNEPGRLTLICRFGADKAADHLPALVRAVKREGRAVVWSCDPMHGNTITADERLQDAAVRPHPAGGEDLLRGPRGRRHACRRRASGDDRPERHRMHRRRARDHATRISTTAITRCAIRGSMPSRRSISLSCWPNCSSRSAPARRSRCRRLRDL